VNERNGRSEKEREEAKKQKISQGIVERITCDSHNKKTWQQYSWNRHEKA
jgi:hypothetical protein